MTYTFRVPYSVPTEAGMRYMNVEAMYDDEAMRLVENMIPNSTTHWPKKLKKQSDYTPSGGGVSLLLQGTIIVSIMVFTGEYNSDDNNNNEASIRSNIVSNLQSVPVV